MKEYSKEYFHSDKERGRKTNARNHDKHRQARLDGMKAYRERNPDKMKALYYLHNKARYWLDPEAAKAKKREWERSNPEIAAENSRRQASLRRVREYGAIGDHTLQQRRELKDSYLGLCVYCAEPVRAKHLDHIVAISRGGCNHIENLVPACARCNRSKGTLSLLQFMMKRAAAR